MYIYSSLLRTADTVMSQNVDLSSWDILYTKLFLNILQYRRLYIHLKDTQGYVIYTSIHWKNFRLLISCIINTIVSEVNGSVGQTTETELGGADMAEIRN
jgi:hypothetical protein